MMINPIWFEYTFLAFLTCTTNLWMMTILQKPMATSLYHHLALCFFINQNAQKFVVESIKFARQSPPLSRHTKCKRYHLTIKRIRQFPIYSSGTVLWKTFVMFFHHNTFIHKLLLVLKLSFKQSSWLHSLFYAFILQNTIYSPFFTWHLLPTLNFMCQILSLL